MQARSNRASELLPPRERRADRGRVARQASPGAGQARRRPPVLVRQRLEPIEAHGGVRKAGDDRQLRPRRPGVPLPPALRKVGVGPLDQSTGVGEVAGVDGDPGVDERHDGHQVGIAGRVVAPGDRERPRAPQPVAARRRAGRARGRPSRRPTPSRPWRVSRRAPSCPTAFVRRPRPRRTVRTGRAPGRVSAPPGRDARRPGRAGGPAGRRRARPAGRPPRPRRTPPRGRRR